MSVFKLFTEKLVQLGTKGQEKPLAQVVRSYQKQVDEANQILRTTQALEREARRSNRSSAASASLSDRLKQ
jgi:tRNA A-37 threonylcarbamoyl transferase component Bud32